MRVFAVLISLLLSISQPTAYAQTISPQETPTHIGQTVAVKGLVDRVFTSGHGNTFLNFGGIYPNQTFTGFIPAADAANFPNVHSLEGKVVRINGYLQLYKGKPEIILHSPSQLAPE